MPRSLWLVFAVGCVGPWPENVAGAPLLDEARVAFAYPGTIGDHGWSFAHNEGRLQLEDDLGVDTTYNELVAPVDLRSVVDADIDEGFNVIYTVSSDYISETQQAAVDNPEVYFLSCCGQATNDNLSSYFGRMYQPIFLAGYLAASMTDSHRLGVVAAKPVPQFIRHINAFTLGARAADPQVVVDIRWLNAFFEPELEPLYTNELMDRGATVILTQSNSSIPVQTVEARHETDPSVYSIGYDNENGCNAGPSSCLASAYWNWGPLYVEQVGSLLDGTWNPTDVSWKPMTNDTDSVVGLSTPATFVPGALNIEIASLRNDLVAEPAEPFVGPLKDNTGASRVAAGVALTDVEMDRLCWFVDGVVSSEGLAVEDEPVPAVVPRTCVGDF